MFCKKMNTYNMALACYPLALHFSFAKQNKNESNPTLELNEIIQSNYGIPHFPIYRNFLHLTPSPKKFTVNLVKTML